MGFTEVLTIVFVILKGTHELNWSWWLVFSPELIAVVFWLLILTGVISLARRL